MIAYHVGCEGDTYIELHVQMAKICKRLTDWLSGNHTSTDHLHEILDTRCIPDRGIQCSYDGQEHSREDHRDYHTPPIERNAVSDEYV